jgi:hypothetical protein
MMLGMIRARTRLLFLVLATIASSCRSAAPRITSRAAATAEHSDAWLNALARGYFPGRSGQIFIVPREGEFLVDRNPLYAFMHGSPWSYDTHIPFLLYGPPFIKQTASNEAVTQQDVVPTLAALLGTAAPNTASGRALRSVLAPATNRPRVVALFVLDGTRADYFDTYRDVLPTVSRLRAAGAWFSNAHVTSIPTLTAVGHANLGTGTEPRTHGLVVNYLFDRVTAKAREAYDQLDPGELMALTLADIWGIQTNGAAVIIGQGGAIRATAGLVGHGACVINGRRVLAASYSARDGGWETNPKCYAMSEALKPLNAKVYWQRAGGTWLGHDIASPATFRHSAVFQRFEGDALDAVLEREPIGADDTTDLVLVNFKGPDYVGHAYGPASREMREELVELDRQIAEALRIIERKAGNNGFALAITADHGMPGEPPSGGRHYLDEVVKLIDRQFSPSSGSIVQYFSDAANNQIYVDTARLGSLSMSVNDVATFLKAAGPFAAVYTEDEVRAAQRDLH